MTDDTDLVLRDYQEDGVEFLLAPEQNEGIRFLVGRDSALLADEMGLGKTVQVVTAVRLLREKRRATHVLVIVPRPLQTMWMDEFSRWAPDLLVRRVEGSQANRSALYRLPLPVVVATYDQVSRDRDILRAAPTFGVVVLDEAQRIKNRTSQTARACRAVPRERSWALTGTPLENRPEELYAIFQFVRRDLLTEGMSERKIHREMKPYFLRRTKDEVLSELPGIVEQEMKLSLRGRQRAAYEDAWAGRNASLKGDASAHMFAVITHLKQLCNYEPETDESVKWETLQVLLENLSSETDKVLVFSQYVKTLRWVSKRLTGVSCRFFLGGQSEAEREATLTWFRTQPGPLVLLMSIKAGGVGLNLPEAATVVLFDRWWNPAVEQQAINRAHRFGRTRRLHVLKFIVENSIEERIDDILKQKQSLFATYVDGAPSAEVGMDRDALREALDLAPSARETGQAERRRSM